MADRMYVEQRKFAWWIIKSFFVSLIVTYIVALISFPFLWFFTVGWIPEVAGKAFEFWTKAPISPAYFWERYVRWWQNFQRQPLELGLFVPFCLQLFFQLCLLGNC